MRLILIAIMVVAPAVGLIICIVFGQQLKKFLVEVREIKSSADIEYLKRIAARQMYAALVQIVVLSLPTITFFFGLTTHILRGVDLIFIIVPSLVILAAGKYYKSSETSVWTMPASDPVLAAERDRIVQVWRSKAVPDW